MRLRNPAVVLLAFMVLVCTATAQTSKGILTGTVRDSTGAVIAHAKISIVSQLTGEERNSISNAEGAYRVEAINPSVYGVHVEAPGFTTLDIKDLHVLPSVVTSYDAVLSAGQVNTTVDVEASTNGVNLENGQLSSTIGATELTKLPIFSLNPVELVATLPGAQFINANSLSLEGAGGQYMQVEINGARPRANNFMLDGQDINDIGLGGQAFQPQIPDMFQSIVTYTNNAPAEYGRAGGGVVNLITKAGSNQFHGSAFELYSGSGLNSVDGITRKGSTSRANKARFDQHQYGFTAGGPIIKDKLFAFGGTMFTRFYGNASSTQIELPDAAGYATLTSIGGPQVALLQSLLANGSYLTQYQQKTTTPVETINAGNQPGCPVGGCIINTANFQRPPIAQQSPDTQWFYRIDFTPREKDTLGFRYLHDRNNFLPDLDLNTSGLPGFDGQVGGPTELASGNWTHVLTPSLLNELRASETRISFTFTATPQALANPVANVENINFTDVGIPVLGLSQNIPQGTKEDAYQFQDTIAWTKGRHSIRAGADVGRTLETLLVAQLPNGELNFAADSNGSALANFLNNDLGASGTATKTFGPTRVDPHIWKSAFFVQDDIKLFPELSINLGLRYDYLTDPGNALPYPGIDLNNPYAPITNVYKIQTDTKNFGPRFGFAYSPSGSGWLGQSKTVIHGGFGIYYDTSFANIAINSAQTAPNAVSGTLTSTAANPLGNATGLIPTIPSSLGPLSSISGAIDKNIANPETYQFNLGVERALPEDLKLVINYVGSRGRKLYANQQYNYLDNSSPAAIALGQRLNPSRGVINARTNSAASEYDSVQVDVSRQFRHGLFFRAAYTFGKNLDDGSEVFALFTGPTSYPANLAPGGRSQDWSASAFDFPQYFSVSYSWSPIGFHADNHVANSLLGVATRNFTVSGVTQLQAGPPSTFNLSGVDTNNDGSPFNDRPLVGNPHASVSTAGIDGYYLGPDNNGNSPMPGTYYDLAANNQSNALNVVTPDQVHWLIPQGGAELTPLEVGRNSFRNPGTTNWNVAVEKDIPAPWTHLESAAFQLRAECQDVFNHNDVGILDTNLLHIGSGNSFLNTDNARVNTNRNLRFWAKFSF
jgi:outer membrane receptor protein involved in Fe transport